MRMFPVLLFLSCIFGCSPQKTLAHRLKGADSVVITNTFDNLSISVTGEEVNKIVKAIAAGKKESPFVSASPYLQFQFFKGAEHLATVPTSVQVFWIEHKPYSDPTGTLEALMYRYRQEHPPKILP